MGISMDAARLLIGGWPAIFPCEYVLVLYYCTCGELSSSAVAERMEQLYGAVLAIHRKYRVLLGIIQKLTQKNEAGPPELAKS